MARRRGIPHGAGVLALVGFLLLTGGPAGALGPDGAGDNSEAVHLKIKILMRALTYETGRLAAGHGDLRVAVVYARQRRPSRQASAAVYSAFKEQAVKLTFRKRRILVSRVDVDEKGALKAAVRAGVEVVYLTRGLGDKRVARVLAVCREHQVISIAARGEYVRSGVTLGVELRDGRPQLMVNLRQARQEGARFSSQLLQLAEILGNGENGEDSDE